MIAIRDCDNQLQLGIVFMIATRDCHIQLQLGIVISTSKYEFSINHDSIEHDRILRF